MSDQLALPLGDERPVDLLDKALAFATENRTITYLVMGDPRGGNLVIANHTGGLRLPYGEASRLARTLADHCTDPEERAWVAETWSES